MFIQIVYRLTLFLLLKTSHIQNLNVKIRTFGFFGFFIFNNFVKFFSYKHTIPLRDALCGLSLRIPTLEGDQIPLKIANIVKPGSTHRYKIF